MFNEIAATAQAEERIARFQREAEVRRFSPRQSFAHFLKSVAFALKPDSVKERTKGGRYVRT